MGISEYIKDSFKTHLNKKYETFKESLNSQNFCPDSKEVWKMYERAFAENTGVYQYVKELLELHEYDSNGRLNELHIYLDEINGKYFDCCSAYSAALMKRKDSLIE